MEETIDLASLAVKVMREKGLEPEYPGDEQQQLALINEPAIPTSEHVDLTSLLWCSIDNDDSKDLDQLTYGEKNGDTITLWIAVADVSAIVAKDSPIDNHAKRNTTSVYTPGRIFSMLPEKLSTNLTSLNEGEKRVAMVAKLDIDSVGDVQNTSIFPALVYNNTKLTYSAVGAWLEGKKNIPEKVTKIKGLEEVLKIQHEAAQILKKKRHIAGSLTLESIEPSIKVNDQNQITINLIEHNFAHQLIEEFMISANRVMAQHFNAAKLPNLRRVVRTPKYWSRIVEVANSFGETLPETPDSKALDVFLIKRQAADPERFPDLSLTIIKLLGRGEYIVENDDDIPIGHFGLALSDYTHSTAPNRRYPDLITQRQYKAHLRGEDPPYNLRELRRLASHCTEKEDAALKVERQLNKSAAAAYLFPQIGKNFKGIVTGINDKGTWVRILTPPADGKIVSGSENLRIGDKVTVQLKAVDIPNGFIDFILVL